MSHRKTPLTLPPLCWLELISANGDVHDRIQTCFRAPDIMWSILGRCISAATEWLCVWSVGASMSVVTAAGVTLSGQRQCATIPGRLAWSKMTACLPSLPPALETVDTQCQCQRTPTERWMMYAAYNGKTHAFVGERSDVRVSRYRFQKSRYFW